MDEKHNHLPPLPLPTTTTDPLLLRIRTSIASLRSTNYAKYNLLPTHSFRHRPASSRYAIWLPHVRRKWIPFIIGGACLMLVFLIVHFVKYQASPVDELGSTSTITRLKHPYFSQETDFYPKKLAILIVPSSISSFETDSKAIIKTWDRNTIRRTSNQVDLWFATTENTFAKFQWPNIWGDDQTSNSKKKGREFEEGNEDVTQENFEKVIEALSFMYENYLNHYDYFMKISDRAFVHVPHLLSSLHPPTDNAPPQLIGQPIHDSRIETTYCARAPGYIISRSLLNHVGPHLSSCLEQGTLSEDEAMARCFKVHVPNFRGCENLPNGSGKEFLVIKNDHPQEEQFSDAGSVQWPFSGVLSAGELDNVEQVKMLWDKYDEGGHLVPEHDQFEDSGELKEAVKEEPVDTGIVNTKAEIKDSKSGSDDGSTMTKLVN